MSSPGELSKLQIGCLAALTAVVYYFSNPKPNHFYDYTFRVAENILGGRIAFTASQPPWLNEFVPFEGFYYSVFPLGSVVTMTPFALLKVAGFINDMPAAFIASLTAGVACLFLFLIANRYEISHTRMVLMPLGILLGTWTWTNLTFGGAWQLALGFAMLGELGAIYFTVYNRRPILAGIFFALAFGNRTEVLLTAPIFLHLLRRPIESVPSPVETGAVEPQNSRLTALEEAPPATAGGTDKIPVATALSSDLLLRIPRSAFRSVVAFCAVPFALGVLTLVYNYVRFHSITDFGYARIPGVLREPWYNHGIFSVYYIPRQIWEMLWKPWEIKNAFPYLMPNPFSSSILLSSPFLLFAFRFGAHDRALKYLAWTAVGILCLLMWMHGNSGGWQFGYRYAMVCLPWLFIILLESSPKKITPLEWAAYIFSFAANTYATWLFHWTGYLRP